MANEKAALENLVVDNPELEKLEDLLAEFNIFDVLKLSQYEIRHSNFLAWLLDPKGAHSLGDYFLKQLLLRSSFKSRDLEINTVTPVDIDIWDLSDTIVLREWNRIDLLLLNERYKFICAIENKVFSGEHSNQLSRYRQVLQQMYPGFIYHYIFLTVDETHPEEEGEREFWTPISYDTICMLIERMTRTKATTMSEEVQVYTRHYTTMLRRHILEDSEVQQLARKIYAKHREAFDLIYEHRLDTPSEVRQIVDNAIRSESSLIADGSRKAFIRFTHKDWDKHPELLRGSGWTASKRLLLFEFKNYSASLTLDLVLGPGDKSVRKAIYDFANQRPEVFKGGKRALTPKWTVLFRKSLLKAQDYEDFDLESTEPKIRENIESFIKNELPKIVDNIDTCLSTYKG